MPRRRHRDYPGAWVHVTNRSIARRTLFETREDVEWFLARLGELCAAGLIEVHAFCVLTTHFHLLVRSVAGRLSHVMQRLLNDYARWFNRTRRRDGPVFRGRFRSKLVESAVYWEAVVRYIDLNPVHAGLCEVGSDYPHASGAAYRWDRGPAWLARDQIQATVRDFAHRSRFAPADYDAFVAQVDPEVIAHLVERRLESVRTGPDPYDDLVRAPALHVQSWMVSKAALADGGSPGLVIVSPGSVIALIDVARAAQPGSEVKIGRRRRSPWELLAAGLLRHVCGLGLDEAGEVLGASPSTVHRRETRHLQALRAVPNYAATAARLVHDALRRDLPPIARTLDLPRRTAVDELIEN
jgi:REP element-mobilizing transposase RayT